MLFVSENSEEQFVTPFKVEGEFEKGWLYAYGDNEQECVEALANSAGEKYGNLISYSAVTDRLYDNGEARKEPLYERDDIEK